MTIERGKVTTWLIEWITSNEFLITDISPEAKQLPAVFGWSGDMASHTAYFNPYVILIPQVGTLLAPQGMGDLGDWTLPYTMTSYGVDRQQVEDLADDLRNHITGDQRHAITMRNGSIWEVTYIECTSIGGVGYNGQVDPAFYSQTDTYVVRISEGL